MKPVVSSLVALVISIAPLTAMAKQPAHHAKTSHVQKAEKKSEKTIAEKGDKSDKSDKGPMVRVKAGKKDGVRVKSAVHHAKDVDLSGAGHQEPPSATIAAKPRDTHGGAIISASMTTKLVEPKKHDKHDKHEKTEKAADKASVKGKPSKDMPKLPAPNAKPAKSAKEGAKKASEKKSEPAASADDGETTRDEELAELVARIRGARSEASAKSADGEGSAEKSAPEGSRPPADRDDARARAASDSPKHVSHQTPTPKALPCLKAPVEIVRGPEVERFELMKCDGSIAPAALERFSVLIRPGGAARPTAPPAELAKKAGPDIAPGIKRVDPRLVERVQAVAEHFGKAGAPAKLFVISGYRPASVGSMHSTGRAMDFRVDGVKNEDVVAFCKTINDTGCGYYPNSSFVHIDVRDMGTGHTAWIDASGPGETPRYVTQWPPPEPPASHDHDHDRAKRPLERTGATERVAPGLQGLEEEGEEMLRAKRPTEESESSVPTDEHPASPAYETP